MFNGSATLLLADDDHHGESPTSRWLKFWLIVCVEPISLLCNVSLIVCLVKERRLAECLHQHVLLLLLIVSFLTNAIEIPRILHYLRLGAVRPSTSASCLTWQWCDYLLFAQSNVLMFWASFERHLLVFNSNLFVLRKYRFYFHYVPLVVAMVYVLVFYLLVIFVYPCEPIYDFATPLCGSPCFNSNASLSLYDLFVHSWIPILLIGFFSLTLILRVSFRQRLFTRQQTQWRRYRRMIVQLLLISSIYLICLGPYTLIQIIDLIFGLPAIAKEVQGVHLFYLYWVLSLLFPFVSLQCLPEVKAKMKKFILKSFAKRNLVVPSALHRH